MPEKLRPSILRSSDLESNYLSIYNVRLVSAACYCMELTAPRVLPMVLLKEDFADQDSHAKDTYRPMVAVINPKPTRECSEKVAVGLRIRLWILGKLMTQGLGSSQPVNPS